MTRFSCETIGYLQYASAILSLLAAAFWFWASWARIPNSIDDFISALQHQSKLNAIAAANAAIAGLLQAFLIAQPTCLAM
ncbi:MAG: hypothetical protein G4V63_32080 [Candidatus Afipia apatlaquensis]|uniref:Uncharacterized protein n=1 Tax=Candidatus Afipia apatlaquensis TaxID=2712852 RepID=A0A7C9RLD0_9BRAD|nr:hypothetical protein [Candidatus Afipia apatlaquensis]